MQDLTALILAAGKGTRMKSRQAKVLHPVGGVPMLELVLRAARAVADDVHVVVGHQAEAVRNAVPGAGFIDQSEQRGTGHAVMVAQSVLGGRDGLLLVLPGDAPLVTAELLDRFVGFHREGGFAAAVLTAALDDPGAYGRIVRRSSHEIDRIVEHRDANDAIRSIREINSGIYLFAIPTLYAALERVRPDNAQQEYYLTDVIGILAGAGQRVGAFAAPAPEAILGINSRQELARVDRLLRQAKCDALMREGVSIMDPATAWIDVDVRIGADSVIHPSVAIEGASVLAEDVTVRSWCRITDSRIGAGSVVLEGTVIAKSDVGADVRIGPNAHIRTDVTLEEHSRVGNFVELKNSRLGAGAKAMHLAYLGDATIGRDVNVGAGAITCNFDGERKHPTVIEDGVFVGSDSQLIAPVRVGAGAYVAAGSTITDDVPPGALAIARGRQVIKEDWARTRKKKAKS